MLLNSAITKNILTATVKSLCESYKFELVVETLNKVALPTCAAIR